MKDIIWIIRRFGIVMGAIFVLDTIKLFANRILYKEIIPIKTIETDEKTDPFLIGAYYRVDNKTYIDYELRREDETLH